MDAKENDRVHYFGGPGMTGATRRRGGALEAAIYDAVFDQLTEVGYRRLTMEGVATAARTGKAALYRRWTSKDDLITDALRHAVPEPPSPPGNKDVRADLLELLTLFRDAVASCRGAAFMVLKNEDGPGQWLLHGVIRERVTGPIKELLYLALVEGAERGEVRPGAATREVADVGPAILTYRRLTEGGEHSDEELVTVVDEMLMPIVRPAG